MKSGILLSVACIWCALRVLSGDAQTSNLPPAKVTTFNLAKAGIKPIGDWQVDPAETQEISQDFANALAAANSIAPGPDWGAQRHAIDNALREEMEAFLIAHPSSAYSPSLHLWLADRAQMRCGYSLAMDHYTKAVDLVSGSPDATAAKGSERGRFSVSC